MKSWKTTLGGALAGLGAAIMVIDPEWAKAGALVTAFGTFFGLLFARDNNVSSEEAGAKKPDGRLLMLVLAPLLAPLLTLVAAGCATPGTPQADSQIRRTGRITATLAFNGTTFALISHPEWAPAFDQAAASLEELSARETLTLIDVYAALKPLPIREYSSPEAKLIVGNAQLILEEIGGGEIDLNRIPHLRAAAAGLARGIKQARAP